MARKKDGFGLRVKKTKKPLTNMNFEVQPELAEKFRALCDKNGHFYSDVFRKALLDYMRANGVDVSKFETT